MHILFITELYPEYEGQSPLEMNPALHDFVREWRASGMTVTVVVPVVTRPRVNWNRAGVMRSFSIDGVSVTHIAMPKMPGFKHYSNAAIVRFARTLPFDVIVSHMQIGLVAGDAVKRDSRKPLIFGVHISDITVLDIPSPTLKKRLFKRRFMKILDTVDGFAFRSCSVRKEFLKNYAIGTTPQTIASSGIPSSLIHPTPEYRYHNPTHIVTACRLIKRKNVDTVLEALSELPGNLPWQYTIIGDGPDRMTLEALVYAKGLESRVTFLGKISPEETIRIMRGGDIFVMISVLETLGMVYLEALAQGMLTIASKGTGVDGIINHGENGYLCRPGDTEELAALLGDILTRKPVTIRSNGYQSITLNTLTKSASRYCRFIENHCKTPHYSDDFK
ncbi:glycosyltransferase family 4 protein [Desulfoplanes sp. PS50]